MTDSYNDYNEIRFTENDKISKYWPRKDSPPRKTQEIALDWISKLPADKKYILCELPVGAGKSDFAVNYAGWLSKSNGDSFILTPQKILQDQYERSFPSHLIGSLKGKGNYECHSKNTNCDIGSDIKPDCGNNCPAKMAKEAAMMSPNMVLNYTLAFLLFKYADKRKFRPRKLMIFDECHTLENHLTEFNAVSISDYRCKKLGVNYYPHKVLERALEWIEGEYYSALCKKLLEYTRITNEINDDVEYNPRKLTKDEQNAFKTLKDFTEHRDALDFIRLMSVDEIKERFVLVQDGKQSFKFKELYGKNVFHSLVKPMADKFLFMSATILNKESYCRDLNIPIAETAFISLESEFATDNRLIIFDPVCKVNYEFFNDDNYSNRQDMVVKVKEICDQHGAESGIIHTSSFNVAEWLVNELSSVVTHTVLHHNPSLKGVTRDDVIAEYLRVAESQPTILISPSITEGLDLGEDKGRFAIFLKTPYPNLGDAWVARRSQISREWYNRQTMIGIMQGAGRIVRSKNDHGITYIVDASFNYLYYQMKPCIPQWWQDALLSV